MRRRILYNSKDYRNVYLTFEVTTAGTFRFSNAINYSLDNGATWTALAANTNTPTINVGDKIMWKATITQSGSTSVGNFLYSTAYFNIMGNPGSLIWGDNFKGQTSLEGLNYIFRQLFYNTKVINANKLSLPYTILAQGCYYQMFYNCTSLVTVPELPATTLATSCYSSMLQNCSSLTSIPSGLLPATILAQGCYSQMFFGCSSLTSIPSGLLPATILAQACYSQMFYGCTSLTSIPSGLLQATTLAYSCYNYMFYGCSSLTSIPNGLLPATSLSDNCYYGMFYECSSLTTVPELPATTLTNSCYAYMFYGCSSLTTAHDLPATVIQYQSYSNMFASCTALTTAPDLPVITSIAQYGLYGMFQNCISLRYIKCLSSVTHDDNNFAWWVSGVPNTGTFIKLVSNTSWSTGYHGIPSGWTVQTAWS